MNTHSSYKHSSSAIVPGIILLTIGGLWLLGSIGLMLPAIFFNPFCWMLAGGILWGSKHNFRPRFGWIAITLVALSSLFKTFIGISIAKFLLPICLIIGGIAIIAKSVLPVKTNY